MVLLLFLHGVRWDSPFFLELIFSFSFPAQVLGFSVFVASLVNQVSLFQNDFAMEESLERGESDTSLPLWGKLRLEQCSKCRTDIFLPFAAF